MAMVSAMHRARCPQSENHITACRASWLKCLAIIGDDPAIAQIPITQPYEHPVIGQLQLLMERALDDGLPCAVGEWAEHLGQSTDHISRVFREHTGETPVIIFSGGAYSAQWIA